MIQSINKKIKRQKFISFAFIALFFVSQLSIVNHQLSHNLSDLSSNCLICLSTTDSIHEFSQTQSLDNTFEFIEYIERIQDVVELDTTTHYLSRAPPIC